MMVVMKHGGWFPWKPGLHLHTRMVDEAKVVDVENNCYHCDGIDGHEKDRSYDVTLEKQNEGKVYRGRKESIMRSLAG